MTYLGARLCSLRKQDGLNQSEVAKAIGVARSTISMWETGEREPDFEALEALADYFNVPIGTFFASGEAELQNKKTVTVSSDDLSEIDLRFLSAIKRLTDQEKLLLLAQIDGILNSRG